MTDWQLFALGSAFFAGLTAVLAKIGVKDIPSNLATLIRVVVLMPFLILLVKVSRDWRPISTLPHRTLLFLVFSGLATGLSWIFYFRALQLGPVAIVSAIDKLSLVVAVILARLILGEQINAWQWTGVFLMSGGALLLVKR